MSVKRLFTIWRCGAVLRYVFLVSLCFLCRASIAQNLPSVKGVDSLGKKAKNAIDQKKDQVSKKIKDKYLNQVASKKALLDSAKKSKKITINNIGVENSTLINANGFDLKRAEAINNISFFGQVQVFKFPLAIDLSSSANEFRDLNPSRDALFKMNFDKSQFQQSYKRDLDKFSRFKKTRLSGMEVQDYLKKNIAKRLKSSSLINMTGFPKLDALLRDKDQLNALLSLDSEQLKQRLDDLMSVQEESALGKLDSVSNEKKLLLQKELAAKKAEVAGVILSLKQNMEESGLDQGRLLLIQNYLTNKGSLKDLDAIFQNEMRQGGSTNWINKFYSNIKALEAGNFGQQMPGSFLNKELMMSGVNFDVKTSRGPVGLGIGINKDSGMPKDANFTGSLYDSPKLLTYVSLPVANFSFGGAKVSWVGGFDRQKGNGFSQLNSLPKTGLAFTVSQNLNIKDLGKLTLEMSKSSTQYKNLSINETDKFLLNTDLKMGNYFREDLFETMSFGAKHQLDLKKIGLSSNAFISYSGLGFQNPAQQGYGNMGMRVGGSLKKSFLRNKIVLNARTDVKNTNISASSGAHWNNYNLQFDSRFRLSRNATVNLKYAENGVDKVDRGNVPVYSSQKMQADFTGNYKIGGNQGFSHLSVGRQLMSNPGVLTNTNFLTMIYSQTVVLKSVSLSGNAFFNKELSGIKILGDMLNADIGCQYNLFKNLNISSAITFLDNQNIARQVGIRQNVQLSLVKNFDISAFFDVRKNLVNPLYPDLFSTGRGELSIRYYLNK